MPGRPESRRRTLRSALSLFALLCFAAAAQAVGHRLLRSFDAPPSDGLVTNEFAYWNRGNPNASRSADWEMTSGSLFARKGVFWTGNPDSCSYKGTPNSASTNCTDSNVFRLNTVRRFAGPLAVSLKLKQIAEIHHPHCDSDDSCWHGTHVWLRYQNQFDLYYVSVNRSDGKVVIKRKVPCGGDNSGTYVLLGDYVPHDFRTGVWNSYTATIQTNPDSSVTIKLYDNGYSRSRPVDVATDHGGTNPNWSLRCRIRGHYRSAAYPPITAAGAVGIRGDYANFEFADFRVSAL